MKQYLILFVSIAIVSISVNGQSVGIGTPLPDNSALLELKSGSKGLLIPRTNPEGRNGISSPAKGLMVYDTTDNSFWYYNGASWNTVGSAFSLPYSANTAINTGNAVFSINNNGLATALYAENINESALGLQVYGGLRGIDATAWNGSGARTSIGVFGTYNFGLPISPAVGGVGIMGLGRGGSLPAQALNAKHFGVYAEANDYGIYAKAPPSTGIAAQFQGQTWFQGTQHISHINFGLTENTYIRAGKDNALIIIGDAPGQRVAIGTGTAANGFSLSVSGKVISEEVQIQLRSAWPDYVFSDQYHLASLESLEQFIQTHHHLPNIPRAAEVEKNGLIVGDMQKRMMEKIEELTLYIIQLQKRIDSLENKIPRH